MSKMLQEVLSKWSKDEVFVQHTVIATILNKHATENHPEMLNVLNELVVLDIATIRMVGENMLRARHALFAGYSGNQSPKNMMEFFGVHEEILPILSINDEYLEYAKLLKVNLEAFFITKGFTCIRS